ncbi:hypothetical protein ACLOJK_031343, partial [Asimina triloba]
KRWDHWRPAVRLSNRPTGFACGGKLKAAANKAASVATDLRLSPPKTISRPLSPNSPTLFSSAREKEKTRGKIGDLSFCDFSLDSCPIRVGPILSSS